MTEITYSKMRNVYLKKKFMETCEAFTFNFIRFRYVIDWYVVIHTLKITLLPLSLGTVLGLVLLLLNIRKWVDNFHTTNACFCTRPHSFPHT